MGSCNPADHPIFWCDELKRLERKRIADESLRDWNHRKLIERRSRAKEQAHYREVMERYSPWGRKGGGAPNDTVRMRNIQLQGLYPETKNDLRNPTSMATAAAAGRSRGVGTGGGGAPIRSASGQIVTGLTDDPLISFNDANRYHVDNELRYKTSPAQKQHYRAELDRIVAEKENRTRKTRSSEAKEAAQLAGGTGAGRAGVGTNGGPWGRPGPGGKPWRPPKNVGHNFMKSMGWTNKETLQDLDLDLVNRMQRQLEEENRFLKRFSNCCSRCVCQCVTNSLEQRSGSAYGARRTAVRPAYQASPPATAPMALDPLLPPPPPAAAAAAAAAAADQRNRVPRLCHQQPTTTGTTGNTTTATATTTAAPGPQQQGQAGGSGGCGATTGTGTGGNERGRRTNGGRVPPTRNCMITGGVELVPLLAKRRSQPRPISLGTTDVTKIDKYTANGSLAQRHDDGYLTDLCNQMHQKQRKTETVRALEFETSRQHFETWSSFWGRPGHGAPLPNKNKLNLDNLLYKPRR